MAWGLLFYVTTMQPIDPIESIEPTLLANVTGGFLGAILGSLLGNAGPILNGLASVIGATKSGRGDGDNAASSSAASSSAASSGSSGGTDPLVSVSVSITGFQQR